MSTARYIVSLSGGTASAVAAERAIQRYGRAAVRLWFADTMWEDDDLYRFLDDCMRRWGGTLYTHSAGRTPLQVAEERSIIPNTRVAPCSFELKVRPFTELLYRLAPVTVLLGLDWSESRRVLIRRHYHRVGDGQLRPPVGYQRRMSGVREDYPLMWRPFEALPYADVVRGWGIAPPRLYALGFPHNNCGGRCVRQGAAEWRRLLQAFPDRFREVRDWEDRQRAKGGARANRSIARLSTLAELEAMPALPPAVPFDDDATSCFCEV